MLSLDLPQSFSPTEIDQTYRILLVEDESVIRDMVVLALEEEGYEVQIAVDGRNALNLLENVTSQQANVFDLVVLDLMLPQIGRAHV